MFFKDLTQVEQLEERERLRDRLASLGEMAAGIAHELKNPLAGIEVMAGLLRRKVPESADAQSLLADIISEAKLANAIVMQMLEFVRPIRLQVERNDIWPTSFTRRSRWPRAKFRAATSWSTIDIAPDLPLVDADEHQLCQVFTNLLTNAFEALGGHGHVAIIGGRRGGRSGSGLCDRRRGADPRNAHRRCHRRRARRAGGIERPDFQSVLHDQAEGLRPGAADRAEDRRRARRTD